MFSKLIPREEKYFQMLTELAEGVHKGTAIFLKLFEDFPNHKKYAEEIKHQETLCDAITTKITTKLNTTFVTPIDREDIYLLVTEIDDIIDLTNGVARRFDIFAVTEPRSEAVQMATLLHRCTAELVTVLTMMEKKQDIEPYCKKISALEKDADHVYREAIRRLFVQEKDRPIEVIKWMEILDSLENSVDRCKDVAEALEAVMVKNK